MFDKRIEANAEQRQAVENIVHGSSWPHPYLLIGLPGTQ